VTTDDELTDAARSLHREWESPNLWPAIAAGISAAEIAERGSTRSRDWRVWAAAAVLVLGTAASVLFLRDRQTSGGTAVPPPRTAERLLSDEAVADIEHAEARYIAAIDALATKVPAVDRAPSPLVTNLRERLVVIDAAIADCRAEIERNRFNTHLRRQLLSIYQEKRRTLEQILEQEQHAP
jgi:hypothetical protein